MTRVKQIVAILFVIILVVAATLFATGRLSRDAIQHYVPWPIVKLLYPSEHVFIDYDSLLKESHWIYDTGIVDANNDGLLDIFTTNHNWRQQLLLADRNGGYHDALSAWGLDQSHEFPGVEISTLQPDIDKSGVYIYWYNRHLYIRTHHMDSHAPVSITVKALTELTITANDGFSIEEQKSETLSSPLVMDSTIRFSSSRDATMELYPRSRGVPMNFVLDSSIALSQVYVGNQLVSPTSHEFSLPLQDRHAMLWSDFNDDGQLDIFITRGAIGGTLNLYPQSITSHVDEEFLVSEGKTGGDPYFKNTITVSGMTKNGCSARHANWVDYNTDGLLDLFINCEDVGHVDGSYPNKLYEQQTSKQFLDVSKQSGLQILDNNIIDYEWFDADNDGDMDLFTYQNNGFYLYRNNAGQFLPDFVHRGKFSRIDNPELKGASGAYWIFDGKLSVSDFDNDGDLDVFSSSKKGNALLINNGGTFSSLDPLTVGLPVNSVSASWVDYDNDGLTDLHTVPEGIFRQVNNQNFYRTNLLILPSDVYMASIINWYDINNDGARDVMIALNENQTLHRWWERTPKDTFLWKFNTHLNQDIENHWLQLKLIGKSGNREAIGSRVTLSTPDGQQIQEVGINDGAFYSQGHYRLYFGLGHYDRADLIKIRWPDGEIQELEDIAGDKILVIERNE
jgi:hypothetical protein